LIYIPLSIYRIHGANGFFQHPELSGVRSYDYVEAFRCEHLLWRAVVGLFFDEAAFFVSRVGPQRYVDILATLNLLCPQDPRLTEFPPLYDYVQSQVERGWNVFRELIGEDFLRRLIDSPSGPSGLRRKVAEFFLTFGRLLRWRDLEKIGNALWAGH